MESVKGILKLRVKKIKLTGDERTTLSMNSYYSIDHGIEKYESNQAATAGKTASWNDEFHLCLHSPTEVIAL